MKTIFKILLLIGLASFSIQAAPLREVWQEKSLHFQIGQKKVYVTTPIWKESDGKLLTATLYLNRQLDYDIDFVPCSIRDITRIEWMNTTIGLFFDRYEFYGWQ